MIHIFKKGSDLTKPTLLLLTEQVGMKKIYCHLQTLLIQQHLY